MTQLGMWVVGYGSLIFKPPPFVKHAFAGTIEGYVRRFWQSSSDHRGTPELPGRVATLVSIDDLKTHESFEKHLLTYDIDEIDGQKLKLRESVEDVANLNNENTQVWGVLYFIEPEHVDEVKKYLDFREQDGYTLQKIRFCVDAVMSEDKDLQTLFDILPREENGNMYIESEVYIGTIDNPSFVGPESVEDTAEIIKKSIGPSGPNIEYLREITSALRDLHPQLFSTDWYLETLLFMSSSK